MNKTLYELISELVLPFSDPFIKFYLEFISLLFLGLFIFFYIFVIKKLELW